MSSSEHSCVRPFDSVSNAASDDASSPYNAILSALAGLGPAPSGMSGLPQLLSSVSAYGAGRDDIIGRYMDHQDELLAVYARGVESVSTALKCLGSSGRLSPPPEPSASSSSVLRSTVPQYKPPLSYEQMQTLNERVGTRHFSLAFESLHAKYTRGYDEGTSFSVHRFGSRGSSLASSNFRPAGPGRCYLMLIAGGHKSTAREMFGLNPTIESLLSAPAHMFSVSALLGVRFTRTEFSMFHASSEGTYSAMAVFVRFMQLQHFNYTYSSSAWDGTLLQAISCRVDFADVSLQCKETFPVKVVLGGEPSLASVRQSADGLTAQQLESMSALADSMFPSRSWRFVQCLGESSETVTVASLGLNVEMAYGSDYSLVGMRPDGDSRFWFPLHASERPNARLRAFVADHAAPSARPSSELVALSRQDFSVCRCAMHVWPPELSAYKSGLRMGSGVVGPMRSAFQGVHRACLASVDTRQADCDFLSLVLSGSFVEGYRYSRVDRSVALYSSSNTMSAAEFGPGYCYLECIRGKFRYRVARLLGPCPRACDVAVMYRAVGRFDPCVAIDVGDAIGHCRRLAVAPRSGGVGLWRELLSLVESRGPDYRLGATDRFQSFLFDVGPRVAGQLVSGCGGFYCAPVRVGWPSLSMSDPVPVVTSLFCGDMLAVVVLAGRDGDVVCGSQAMVERVRFLVRGWRVIVFSGAKFSECTVPDGVRLWYGEPLVYSGFTCFELIESCLASSPCV